MKHHTVGASAVLAPFIVFVALLAGCGERLMPTPVVFGADRVDPFTSTAPEDADPETVVFIASTRAPGPRGEGSSWPRFYSNDRGENVVLARATVRMGDPASAWAELRAASLARPRPGHLSMTLTKVEEYGPLAITVRPAELQVVRSRDPVSVVLQSAVTETDPVAARFLDDVNAHLERSHAPDIYVYVHGFNTSFVENTCISAGLWHFLGRNGVMISYAWPSRNSLFGYGRDLATAQANDLDFRALLWFLHERTNAERIHIVAHSAGSPIVVRSLKDLRLTLQDLAPMDIADRSRIGQVVLAAPDMDLAHFSNALLDGFDQIPEGVTIYVNTDDGALGLSQLINGFARLGNPIEIMGPRDFDTIRGSDTITVVDVAEAEQVYGSLLGHGYFVNNPWVSADLLMLVRHGAGPAERGLVQDDETFMWGFPELHVESVVPLAEDMFEATP